MSWRPSRRPACEMHGRARRAALGALILCHALCGGAWAAAGDPARLLHEGIALLDSGSYAEALARFRAAGLEVPAAPEPYFFAGATLNRLGHAQQALPMLDRATFLYDSNPQIDAHPELDFERGWALLGVGRFAEATRALERYEAQHPGRGQTAEFLGRAALGRGDYEVATDWFDSAEARDPNLAGTVALARAAMAEKRGDRVAAERALAAALARPENTRLSRLLAERIPPTPAQAAANYGLTLGLGAGHNSNALALGDDQPVTSSADGGEDSFQRFLLSGFYQWRPRGWAITASYSLQADQYDDADEVDQLDNLVGLRAERALTAALAASVEVQNRYTRIDDEGLLNEVSVAPLLSWRVREHVALDFGYEYADGDFLTRPGSAALDRDHHTHSLAPALRWTLPALSSQLYASYAHRWVSAAGSDFDADADAITLRVDSAWPWRLSSRALLFYESRDFDRANSLSASGARRADDFYYASVFVQRPLGDVPGLSDRLRVYAQYDYSDRNSNIGFYAYHQHTFGAGVLFAF